MKNFSKIAAASFMIISLQLSAQERIYSELAAYPALFQHYENPAFAGARNRPSLLLEYVNIFPTVLPSNQFNFSFDKPIGREPKSAFGLSYRYERFYNTSQNKFDVSYSKTLTISEDLSISLGVSGGYNSKSINYSAYSFPDEIDPFYGFVKETEEKAPAHESMYIVGLDFGVSMDYKNFFAGLSANRLLPVLRTEPIGGSFRDYLPVEFSAIAGYKFVASEDISILPMLRYDKYGSAPSRLMPMVYVLYKDRFTMSFEYYNFQEIRGATGFRLFRSLFLSFNAGFITNPKMFEMSLPSYLQGGLVILFKP